MNPITLATELLRGLPPASARRSTPCSPASEPCWAASSRPGSRSSARSRSTGWWSGTPTCPPSGRRRGRQRHTGRGRQATLLDFDEDADASSFEPVGDESEVFADAMRLIRRASSRAGHSRRRRKVAGSVRTTARATPRTSRSSCGDVAGSETRPGISRCTASIIDVSTMTPERREPVPRAHEEQQEHPERDEQADVGEELDPLDAQPAGERVEVGVALEAGQEAARQAGVVGLVLGRGERDGADEPQVEERQQAEERVTVQHAPHHPGRTLTVAEPHPGQLLGHLPEPVGVAVAKRPPQLLRARRASACPATRPVEAAVGARRGGQERRQRAVSSVPTRTPRADSARMTRPRGVPRPPELGARREQAGRRDAGVRQVAGDAPARGPAAPVELEPEQPEGDLGLAVRRHAVVRPLPVQVVPVDACRGAPRR